MLLAKLWRPMAVRRSPETSRVGQARSAGLLVLFLALSTWTSAAAECRVPSYRTGHVWEDTASSIMVNISIQARDFVPSRLVCLAEALKRRYSDRKEIDILVFGSLAAARRFTMPLIGDWVDSPHVNPTAQLHAKYHRNVDKQEDFVIVGPVGNRQPVQRIHLPANSTPPCTFQVAGRCLLAIDRETLEYYPSAAWRANVSASVTLAGAIDKGGRVTNVKAIEMPASSRTIDLILQAALRNLRTWRFEPAQRRDSLRITYVYRVDPTAPTPGTPMFRLDLPYQVEIRVPPMP
jgi:TonB family protein